MDPVVVLALVAAIVVVFLVASSVRIVPQARRYNIERFGRYRRTLQPGLNLVVPVADRINTKLDVREQVYSSDPRPVITEDNLVVNIDTVLYYQITDPRSAAYEVADYLQAIDQLTVTTLRNVIGSMDLEETLTSREEINSRLRAVLDTPSRRRWRSRCGPSVTSERPSCTPRGSGKPRSSRRKARSRRTSWRRRARNKP